MSRITDIEVHDLRFPTSSGLHGSDAMNPDPDYSCAYVILKTDCAEHSGYGLTFTIGRGNELCVAGVRSLGALLVGLSVESLMREPRQLYQRLTGDSQFRWVGPEKGVIHLAAAALINAVWDLWARMAGKPLWRLLVEMSPEQIVNCIDFRHITDALTPSQAIELLRQREASKPERIERATERGVAAYTTSAGWLGYPDNQLRQLCSDYMSAGWSNFKIKVGRDLEDDIRRCKLIRELIGPANHLMVDANQVWEVDQAIEWIRELAPFNPWFVEEPLSPDDILGHAAIAKAVAPIRIATGEMCHNRIMFKQFLQAGGMQVCQLDSCRVGGVNECLAVMLLAARFDVPVCSHAGGVGLCEYVQHLSLVDDIAVAGTSENRITEYSDHLHEHFVDPPRIANGAYMPPTLPGYSAEMRETAMSFEFA